MFIALLICWKKRFFIGKDLADEILYGLEENLCSVIYDLYMNKLLKYQTEPNNTVKNYLKWLLWSLFKE